MGLSPSDLVWLQRLPAPTKLTPSQLREVQRMAKQSNPAPGDRRLLNSLLTHAGEIEERETARRDAADRRNIITQRLDPDARRLAADTREVGLRRLEQHKITAGIARWKQDNPLPNAAGQVDWNKDRQAAERRITKEVQSEMAERRAKGRQAATQQYSEMRAELQDL